MASNWDRIGKPFNPLLGETYELHTDNFKWISEQVSHHPPMSAFFCESPLFKFHGTVHPKLKFWGKSVEVTPRGNITLHLLPWNEAYTWQNVTCTVHNVIIGKIWIEHSGVMKIQCHPEANDKAPIPLAEVTCHPVGWFGRNMHRVTGEIRVNGGSSKHTTIVRRLYGKWTEALFSVEPEVWAGGQSVEDNTNQSADSSTLIGQQSPESPGSDTTSPSDSDCGQQQQSINVSNAAKLKHGIHNHHGLHHKKHHHRSPNHNISPKTGDSVASSATGVGSEDVDDPVPQDCAPCDLGLSQQRLVWRAEQRPANSAQFYNFTSYTMGLNQTNDQLTMALAPTDCRFRQDMRLMEEGCIDDASVAKTELEEKQRGRRPKSGFKVTNGNAIPVTGPIWFVEMMNPVTKKTEWTYTGRYWERDWSQCPEIF